MQNPDRLPVRNSTDSEQISTPPLVNVEALGASLDQVLSRRNAAKTEIGGQFPLFREPLFRLTPSTFLKISMLSIDEAKQEVRKRIEEAAGRGYDRYRYLRNSASTALVDGASLGTLRDKAKKIKNDYERRDTLFGLVRFWRWLRSSGAKGAHKLKSLLWISPNRLFAVRVRPEAGFMCEGELRTVTIYNTRSPSLDAAFAKVGALLIEEAYAQAGQGLKYNHELLALRNVQSYVVGEEERAAVRIQLIKAINTIELLALEIVDELESASPPG
ncbi:hypothetical protein [Caulobacter sp. NIBR1757]|uniref:hypothetical protein n=1 Tax=Caulobacter sp. NIBR1757 TaxID=3016000 RepID=UPI0022F0D19A|nr:hypothetical protein [Caulobacter sp. NIBR1757]WGM39288.1 hypothetical protein AMEJIAPC_02205 [Caulobacter sp. NIBR1757]